MTFTEDEINWLTEGLDINATVSAKAVPHEKLRELLDCREALRPFAENWAGFKRANPKMDPEIELGGYEHEKRAYEVYFKKESK